MAAVHGALASCLRPESAASCVVSASLNPRRRPVREGPACHHRLRLEESAGQAGRAAGPVSPGGQPQTSHPKAQPLFSFLNCPSSSYSSHTVKKTQTTVMGLRPPAPLFPAAPLPHSLPLRRQPDRPFSSGRLGKPLQLFAPDPSWAPESQSALRHPLPQCHPACFVSPAPPRAEADPLEAAGVAGPCFHPESVLVGQAALGSVPSGPETRRERETGGH